LATLVAAAIESMGKGERDRDTVWPVPVRTGDSTAAWIMDLRWSLPLIIIKIILNLVKKVMST